MSAYFLDLDGVILKDGTNEFNHGALAFIKRLNQAGHQIVFTTRRRWREGDRPPAGVLENVEQLLKEHCVKYHAIVPDVSSPRVVIDDRGARSVNFPKDAVFSDGYIKKIVDKDEIVNKVYNALLAIAWTAKQFGVSEMDDYIQTVIIGESLVANNGFNHRDLVRRYRTKPGHIIENQCLPESGQYWKGMIRRLIEASSLDYMAEEEQGITNGCAMKVICLAPFYLHDFREMVFNTDKFTRVTHNFVDGRLAALLVVLRARQILLGTELDSMQRLKAAVVEAVKLLGLEGNADFFIGKLTEGMSVVQEVDDPRTMLTEINRITGLTKAANSAPIAACLFSFKAKNNFRDHLILRQIPADDFKNGGLQEYRDHFVKMGRSPDVLPDNEIHNDKDTFSSIAFSLISLQHGLGEIEDDAKAVEYEFSDNLRVLAENLVRT